MEQKLEQKPQRVAIVRQTKYDEWFIHCPSLGIRKRVENLNDILFVVRSNPDYKIVCRFESEV